MSINKSRYSRIVTCQDVGCVKSEKMLETKQMNYIQLLSIQKKKPKGEKSIYISVHWLPLSGWAIDNFIFLCPFVYSGFTQGIDIILDIRKK